MTAYSGTFFTPTFSVGTAARATGPTYMNVFTNTYFSGSASISLMAFPVSFVNEQRSYINRVYDSTASKTVKWVTVGTPDPTGASYPGPGTFGVHTSSYAFEGPV